MATSHRKKHARAKRKARQRNPRSQPAAPVAAELTLDTPVEAPLVEETGAEEAPSKPGLFAKLRGRDRIAGDPAGLPRRFCALAIDYLLVGTVASMLSLPLARALLDASTTMGSVGVSLISSAVFALAGAVYALATMSLLTPGQTLGKLILGLRVLDERDRPLTGRRRVLVREVALKTGVFVPLSLVSDQVPALSLICSALGIGVFAWALTNPLRRHAFDLLARTRVIRG